MVAIYCDHFCVDRARDVARGARASVHELEFFEISEFENDQRFPRCMIVIVCDIDAR